MLPSADAGFRDDDEFDWAAAVAEIENAETGFYNKVSNDGQNRISRQKTINSFFETRPKAPELTHQENDECQLAEGIGVPIDPVAAKTWVYPANVPRRDYQFSITKTALFTNTLVSLPTGLGKTLIAAVVIYNFYRWFPDGKIVFTAPSRPLVVQQIEACHNVVGIPQDWTIDMTGQINPPQRAELWKSKRVFFVTPQVLEKDINSGTCPLKELVCLIVDEAHRALGNYSYCVVVREIMAANVMLRILALTATPGSKQATIQAVVDNLNISCLEYRDEDDPDVSLYIHNRKLELIPVVMNAESNKVRDIFMEILQPVVLRLCNFGVFYSKEIARLTPYEFVTAREKFRQAPPAALAHGQYGEVEASFGVAITLYHIFKLLFSHGMRPALEMLQQKLQQGLFARMMGRNEKVHQIKLLMQQSISHGAPSPKLAKMEEIILEHFGTRDPGNTRVIIFTNFRESVKDIMGALAKLDAIVKAMEFIGQSSGKYSKGQSQKMQQAVLQKFRTGGYNTIVATSIGEEGLDIMEVDLVICFDANISPLRMIQRMGRTGRKRDGRVVVLASEGTELQGYLKKQAKSKAIGKHMHNGGINSFNFHNSSRMVPHAFRPELQLMELTIEQFVPRGRKAKSDTRAAFNPSATDLTNEELSVLMKYFKPSDSEAESWNPSLIAFPHYQLIPTPIHNVKHSSRTTAMLINVLQGLRGLPTLKSDEYKTTSFTEDHNPLLEDHNPLLENQNDDGVPEDMVQYTPERVNISSSSPLAEWPTQVYADPYDVPAEVSDGTAVEGNTVGTALPSTGRTGSEHHCLFSTGVVAVTDTGYVLISSPPRLPGRTLDGRTSDISSKAVYECKVDDMGNSLKDSPHSPGTQIPKSGEFVLETPKIREGGTVINHDVGLNLPSPVFYRHHDTEISMVPSSPMIETHMVSETELQSRLGGCHNRNQEQTPRSSKLHCADLDQSDNSPLVKEIITDGSLDVTKVGEESSKISSASAGKALSDIPLQGNSATRSSGDCPCDSSQLPSVVRRPPRLKRLRRGRELISPSGSTEKKQPCAKQIQPSDIGKHQRKLIVQPFIDDEAEVSSDEEVSADDDNEAEDDELVDLEDFIDDNVQSNPSASQMSGGPVDMMAIYRRSLLTQSPSEGLAPWMRFLPPSTTPASSSFDKSCTSVSSQDCSVAALDSGLKSVSISLPRSTSHSPRKDSSCENTVKAACSTARVPNDTLPSESNTLELRKRKLSFHPDVYNSLQANKQYTGNQGTVEVPNVEAAGPSETIPSQEVFNDDLFDGLDLDALEAEALRVAAARDDAGTPKQNEDELLQQMDGDFESLPSFDLGI